jgi:hypothetical protein
MLTLFRLATDEADLKADGGRLAIPDSPASMCRLATGRSALLHMINRLPRLHRRTVLLPCYVAEGVIQPFDATEFAILFYRLQLDLTPRVEDIEVLLEQVNGVAIVVLVHYFGFSARSPELESVLGRYSPVVIDDLAHAPFATGVCGRPLAENAQIALFSLNKFLPVADGAILVSNRPDIDVSIDEDGLVELPGPVQSAYRNHLQSARDLCESHDPFEARISLRNLASAYELYYSAINSDLRPFRQSARSRRVEEAFPFGELIERRSINSRILYEGLTSSVFSLVHPTLPPAVVPFCIPARVPGRLRGQLLDALFNQGVVLSTLQEKWDFVPAIRRFHYPVESTFLDEHVLIPVSEFITAGSMRGMVARLNDFHTGSDIS